MRLVLLLAVLVTSGCAAVDPDECARIRIPASVTSGGDLAGTARPGSGGQTGSHPGTVGGSVPVQPATDEIIEVNCRERLYKPGEQKDTGTPMGEPKPL